ncbi:MAG: DNA-formamidopyrimidine glycosylase [Mycoplasmataceae bacterium]|nr:DNA-formamidopyrimidine glycosylase [Mycoplasmataceae bacterium]
MPELPEVQTVVNHLNKKIVGQKIINLEILQEKMIKNISITDFKAVLIGSIIQNIDRVGKYLIFHLDNGYVMVSHLRMEGKYLIRDFEDIEPLAMKHVHIIFTLEKFNLCYHDTRKFGTFTLYESSDFLNSKELSKIAIDPLNDGFDYEYLFSKINKSKKPIKTLLLGQELVSGIGNIYVCEILFSARVSPFKLGSLVSEQECKLIVKESKRILKLAIEKNGTTVSSFSFDNNHAGTFQDFLNVYGKQKLPCSNCNSKIVKDYISKRGTYFCNNCQK